MDSKPTKRDFKKGIRLDDSRRRREGQQIQLRKDKKEEGIAKKRNLLVNNFVHAPETASSEKSDQDNVNAGPEASTGKRQFTVKDIPELMNVFQQSIDAPSQINAMRAFRRLLSVEKNPPVQECIDCGALPFFVHFLQRNDMPELQFEAAWALTNIASTNRTRLIVEFQAVQHLIPLLMSANPDLREQSAWCLGNVAGDGAELRDIVLSAGALVPLLTNITSPASLSLLRNCTWSLSNVCRGKPQPPLKDLLPAIPVIASLIMNNTDQETVVDAMWAASYISDGNDERIQAVVDQGVIPALVQHLNSGKSPLIVPALRTLGNVVSGSDAQTQVVIAANVLPALVPLLANAKKNIRKETCWMLSNIAAGSNDQIDLLFTTPDLLSGILHQLSASAEWDVRREAVWAVSNIATAGRQHHVVSLVEHGVVGPLCELLNVHEVKILMIAMEALEAILKLDTSATYGGHVSYAQLVDEAGGVDHLELLQEHENTGVYERAVRIIETFFGGEEEGDVGENLAPSAGENGFEFGTSATGNAAIDFGHKFIDKNRSNSAFPSAGQHTHFEF